MAAVSTAASFGADKTTGYLVGIGLGSVISKSHVNGTVCVLLKGGKTVKDLPVCINKARSRRKNGAQFQ